ncbi:MAG: hypothetical protein NTZ90_17400 [Proteobacteria bacterium]|nr:hypothetical protein [Pseudomonadota bacterium]
MGSKNSVKDQLLVAASIVPALCLCLFAVAASVWDLGFSPPLPFDYYYPAEGAAPLTAAAVAQLAEDEWTPMTSNRMYEADWTEKGIWLRVKVPVGQPDQHVNGRINHVSVRNADFYLGIHHGEPPQLIGSSQDAATWSLPTEPSFHVSRSPMAEQRIYINIEKCAIWAVPFFVQDDEGFNAKMTQRQIAVAVVIGYGLAMIIACMVFLLILRQPIFWLLTAQQAFVILCTLIYTGELLRLVPALAHEQRLHLMLMEDTFLIATYLATRSYMQHLLEKTRYEALLIGKKISVLTLAVILILPLASTQMGNVAIVVYFITVLSLFSAQQIVERRHDDANFIAISGSVLIAAITSGFLVWTGLIVNSVYLEFAPFVSASWMSTILMADIARRMRRIKYDRQKIIAQLQNSSEQMLASGSAAIPADLQVSIMFIDIASFSTIAEAEDTEVMFNLLSKRMLAMIQIIESHGGTIDRSLGDGLLCYFPSGATHHALRALNAAKRIQGDIIAEAMVQASKKHQSPILPVRIGIHSDKVLIGNMGGGSRIDFTMVGQGVNLANRLEQACAPYRIMISCQTFDHLRDHGFRAKDFSPIQIPVKHRTTLMLAYEHEPFSQELEELNAVVRAQQSSIHNSHRIVRHRLKVEDGVSLTSREVKFTVEDFSMHGFKATSATFMAQGSMIELQLDTGDQQLNQSLEQKLLTHLCVEVRWSRSKGEGYEHGLYIVGDTPAQASYRLSVLLTHPGAPLVTDIAA